MPPAPHRGIFVSSIRCCPERPSGRSFVLVLTIAGLLAQLAFVGMVLLGDLRQHTLPFLGLFGLAGVAYAGAVI